MLCMKCGAPVGDTAQYCENCRPILEAQKQAELHEYRMQNDSDRSRQNLLTALKVFGALVVVALVVVIAFTPKVLPEIKFPTNYGDSRTLCPNHKNCAVAYVAPWCPHCKSAIKPINAVKAYMSKYPNIGFEIVVGMDKRDTLKSFASHFGGEVIFDEAGLLYKTAGVKGVPAMFSISSDGELLGRCGLYRGMPAEKLGEVFIRELNLEK